jgi:hypothetical protein
MNKKLPQQLTPEGLNLATVLNSKAFQDFAIGTSDPLPQFSTIKSRVVRDELGFAIIALKKKVLEQFIFLKYTQ